MNMTLKQQILAIQAREETISGQNYKYVRLEEVFAAIDAHLARQPEVSEEDIGMACDAFLLANPAARTCGDKEMRAALTAVWHNRQAQEKAEPVAVIGPVWQLLWFRPESIAAIAKKHGLKIGDKLYTAPPAERVRVPDAREPEKWHESERDRDIDIAACNAWNACRNAVLSATPSPAIDVASVREVIAYLRNRSDVPAIIRAEEQADKLAIAIGDAK